MGPKLSMRKKKTPQLDRLSSPKSYANELGNNDLKGLLTLISKMTMQEIASKVKDKNLTGAEYKAFSAFIRSASHKDKDQFSFMKYVDDRTYGKVPDIIEHTGKTDSAPIEINMKSTTVSAISNMTKEELINLKKISQSIIDKNKN